MIYFINMKRTVFIGLMVFVVTISSAAALDSVGLDVETGALWLHNEAYGVNGKGDKDPDPIVYKLGIALPLYFSRSFFFSPELAISGKSWQWVDANQWAMPVDPMWEDLYVMAFNLNLPVGFQLNFKSFSAGFFVGPLLRFSLPLWGENSAVRSDMLNYFLSDGRFLDLAGGIIFVIPLSEKMSLTLKSQTVIPLHNAWSDGGLPFSDGLSVSISGGVRFNLLSSGSQEQ